VKPPAFAYHTPGTLAEAIALLSRNDNARVLAGGQTLMPMLNLRIASPDHLVDLRRIKELAYIREERGEIAFGAMTRQREIEYSALVRERIPLLAEAVRWIGHRQTRNRGTIGGSLCHLDPSAELPAVAMALDATLRAVGPAGTREIAMKDFSAGFMTTVLAPQEVLTEIRMRPWPAGHGWAFLEFARRRGDFAVVSVCALLQLDTTGRVQRASVTLGGVSTAPVRVTEVERALAGKHCDSDAIERSAKACAAMDALDDPYAPGWYRKRLAETLSRRALVIAAQRARGANR
jgi:carbon-monoxide dehydrogenase medium subunit